MTVGMIVGLIGSGTSVDELLATYPYLEREDFLRPIRCPVLLAQEREVLLVEV